MIVKIPHQKLSKSGSSKPFDKLVKYATKEIDKENTQQITSKFENILNYETSAFSKDDKEKCVAIRTHAVKNVESASDEMNAVAMQNRRCKDPAYHFLISWHEFEKNILTNDSMFEAAEHALNKLGLSDHQYVLAIHMDTDNPHVHIAVNRVNPNTYRAKHLEWAVKTLHMAARESEIKHGWFNDNGYYVVNTDAFGNKTISLNEKFIDTVESNGISIKDVDEDILPAWHDPESLESWLKMTVARDLKRSLPNLQSWHGLHAWLSNYGISLSDSGGGGLRLTAKSSATGDFIDLAASKGLRILKRKDLENRWGNYTNLTQTHSVVSDLSGLSKSQLTKGIKNVIERNPDHNSPPLHIIHNSEHRRKQASDRASGMHAMPVGGLDVGRSPSEVLLQDSLHLHLGNEQAGEDQDVRRTGPGEKSGKRGLVRDNSKREERKKIRAAQRTDLRNRFAQYRRFTKSGDIEYFQRLRDLKLNRAQIFSAISSENKKAVSALNMKDKISLVSLAHIDVESARQKIQAEASYQESFKLLRQLRLPPLGWREWLYEQANLYDQAALSALRGIVYQAQRDAKKKQSDKESEDDIEIKSAEDREEQYRRLMKRLFEEERNEISIRSARFDSMRPYQIDSLLAKYSGINWLVTGNGNIEYSEQNGNHLFTDRGNRVTFDRVMVSDDEIRLALVHARNKFGNKITLSGDDRIFTERMARMAIEMNINILNPDLQPFVDYVRVENSHKAFSDEIVESTTNDIDLELPKLPDRKDIDFITEKDANLSQSDILRLQVLSIEPRAKFEMPDFNNNNIVHTGIVVASLDDNSGFAQHIGRGIYMIHLTNTPEHNNQPISVQYQNEVAKIVVPMKSKGKGE